MTSRLNSSARAAIDSNSVRVKTLPTGLCGVLTTIILVRGVIARLAAAIGKREHWKQGDNSPQFLYVYRPIIASDFVLCGFAARRMQGNVYRGAPIEGYGWQILVKEGFEENYFVALLQEGREDRVLS